MGHTMPSFYPKSLFSHSKQAYNIIVMEREEPNNKDRYLKEV